MTLLLHPARNGRLGVSGANVLPPVGLAEERDKDLVFMEVRALGPILRKKIVFLRPCPKPESISSLLALKEIFQIKIDDASNVRKCPT